VGKYTSLARALRDEPEKRDFGKDKGDSQRNTNININKKDKRIDSNPSTNSRGSVTTLRPTTLTTLIPIEKDERAPVVCIHNMAPSKCALCSGYVRWLIEDDARISAAQNNPEATRQRYREIVAEGSS
jgi:hypothetical protein